MCIHVCSGKRIIKLQGIEANRFGGEGFLLQYVHTNKVRSLSTFLLSRLSSRPLHLAEKMCAIKKLGSRSAPEIRSRRILQ